MAITFIFCIILGRLLYVQIAWGADLQNLATDQWNREIPVVAARGIISDRNGTVLAGNKTTYSVFIRPNAVQNAEYTATILSGVFDLDPKVILEKIQGGKVSEVTVARQVDKESIEKLVSYDLAGVYYSLINSAMKHRLRFTKVSSTVTLMKTTLYLIHRLIQICVTSFRTQSTS